jgi:hypothetical protein
VAFAKLAGGETVYPTSAEAGEKVHGLRAGTIRQRNELIPQFQFWTRPEQSWISQMPAFPRLEKQ